MNQLLNNPLINETKNIEIIEVLNKIKIILEELAKNKNYIKTVIKHAKKIYERFGQDLKGIPQLHLNFLYYLKGILISNRYNEHADKKTALKKLHLRKY